MVNMNLTYIEKYARIHVTKGGISVKNYGLINLLDANAENFTTIKGIERRKKIAKLLKKVLIMATQEKIIVENYPELEPDTPYIFASTHGFSNDIIACLATIDRSAYLLMGSTNQVEYNKLMYFAWLNGFIYVDRTNSDSRKTSVDKMEKVLKNGSSILLFPEGGHNNTENNLCNRLFSGPYLLAKRTGAKVVPIAPFYEFGSNKIYMNYGNPIDLASINTKEEAMQTLRDIFSTMVYENIEKYSTALVRNEMVGDIHLNFMEERRLEYLKNPWTRDVWEEELTRYLNNEEKEEKNVLESYDHIDVNLQNAEILAPMLVKRYEQSRYNFNDYMHNNWNREKK